jgi:hypothetical protein
MTRSFASQPVDYARHNAEVEQVWECYYAGKPVRVPCGNFNITQRIWVLDPSLNTEGITWKAMCEDPEVMFNTYLKFRYYAAHNIPYDILMGIPDTAWEVRVEFWNVAEEAWLGCPLIYPEGQVHTTVPRFAGEHKEDIFERDIPGPFDGLMGKVRAFHECFLDKARDYEYCGRPVTVTPPSVLWTNGPLTLALVSFQ